MITQKEITSHVKSLLESFLDNDIELSSLKREYHEELYYKQNNTNDIDITICLYPGDIETKVVQYPVQIFIDVKTELQEHLMNVLHKLALSNNEMIVDFGESKIKQYFMTPSVASKFVKSGIYEYVSLSLNCRFFEYENLLDVEHLYIDNEEVDFISLGLSYVGSTNSDGGANFGGKSETGIIRQVVKSNANTYVFSAIPKQTKLFRKLIALATTGKSMNRKFKLRLDMDVYDVVSVSSTQFSAKVQEGLYYYKNLNEFVKVTNESYLSTETYYQKVVIEDDYICPQISLTKEIKNFPLMQVTLARSDK